MQVILLEKIRKLGNLGETVAVKRGFGRNYLVPQGKAVYATESNIKAFEARRAELEKKAQAILAEAEKRAAVLNKITLTMSAQASDEGKLYGSIGLNEIKEAFAQLGHDVSRRDMVLPEGPIHTVGEGVVEILLHSDVIASVQIVVTAA